MKFCFHSESRSRSWTFWSFKLIKNSVFFWMYIWHISFTVYVNRHLNVILLRLKFLKTATSCSNVFAFICLYFLLFFWEDFIQADFTALAWGARVWTWLNPVVGTLDRLSLGSWSEVVHLALLPSTVFYNSRKARKWSVVLFPKAI